MRRFVIFISLLVTENGTVFSQLPQLPQDISTRFGLLSVGKNRMLLFNGRPLNPQIEGNNSLNLGKPFRIGATDVVLIRDNGGTACPFLYYFLTVSKSGAQSTPSFGTCGEITNLKRVGTSISVTMRGYRGPFEPAQERKEAENQRHVFIFNDGVIVDHSKQAHGLPVPPN